MLFIGLFYMCTCWWMMMEFWRCYECKLNHCKHVTMVTYRKFLLSSCSWKTSCCFHLEPRLEITAIFFPLQPSFSFPALDRFAPMSTQPKASNCIHNKTTFDAMRKNHNVQQIMFGRNGALEKLPLLDRSLDLLLPHCSPCGECWQSEHPFTRHLI